MVEIDAKPGDYVKLKLAREELECTMLESYDAGVILVKLKSGYNIGVPRENVYGVEVLRRFESKKEIKKIEQKKGLPLIGLIVTGGTIASKLDSRTGAVSALTDVNELAQFYPGLFEIANVRIDVPFMKLSENMNSEDWIILSESVNKMMDDKEIQGIVITHGTDTLHYTSAALSFFLGKLNKPVVLTFAQRSIDRASSDADLNLRCAAKFALSDCAEVVIVGHANLDDEYCFALRGTKVRKMHTSRRDAFKSINCEPIAKIWPDKVEFLSQFKARHEGKNDTDITFNDKVALIKFYPGASADLIDYYRMHGYKGIVIEVLGLGGLPVGGANSWEAVIKKAIREGMIVCGASQTIYGRLNAKVYSGSRELENLGMIFLEDMLAETAFVKLGWVLGHRTWRTPEKIREMMLENVAGELKGILTI